MKSLFLFAILVATATVESCTPGSSFKQGCNSCLCGDDGKTAACTLKACINENGENPEVPKEDEETTPEQVCTPLAKFKDYCNDCFCAEDGLSYSCTRMSCDETIWNKDGSLKIEPASRGIIKSTPKQVCTPSMKFKDYCNDCACANDGLSYACTRMACDRNIWNRDGSLKTAPATSDVAKTTPKQVCEPGKGFKEYCNQCACADDGLSYACTRRMCEENMWNKDGTMKYIPKAHGAIKDSKGCEPGRPFSPDGCNSCACNEDGSVGPCTRMICVPGKKLDNATKKLQKWGPLYKKGDACSPGEHFFSECNGCVCSASGKSAMCTLMACPVMP